MLARSFVVALVWWVSGLSTALASPIGPEAITDTNSTAGVPPTHHDGANPADAGVESHDLENMATGDNASTTELRPSFCVYQQWFGPWMVYLNDWGYDDGTNPCDVVYRYMRRTGALFSYHPECIHQGPAVHGSLMVFDFKQYTIWTPNWMFRRNVRKAVRKAYPYIAEPIAYCKKVEMLPVRPMPPP